MSITELGTGKATPRLQMLRHGLGRLALWMRQMGDAEAAARSGFALWPIGMGFGIAAYFSGYDLDLLIAVAGLVIVLGAKFLVGSRGNLWNAVVIVLAGYLTGQVGASIEVWHTKTTILSGEATTRITGHVRVRETDERGRQRYVLDLSETQRPTLSRPPKRVRILVSSKHEPLEIGATYHGLVRLRPPAGPAYPQGHDFSYTPYFDGLGAYGFALGAPSATPVVSLDTADRIARLRLAMGERIRSVLPGPTGAVASALITGERAGIPPAIENALRATSLAHILSISGFHMALVAAFCMAAVRGILACIPAVALRWPVRKIAAIVALAATTFYVLLSGDNAATERSFIMIAVMLGSVLLDRPSLTLRNVALSALIVMAMSPHVVLTPTFQMSFAATAALVGAFGAYARWRNEQNRKTGSLDRSMMRSVLLALVATALSSLIAGAATAPFGIYQFQRVAPFGLIANLVATPLFSFWVMPLALIAAVLMPFGLERWPLLGMGQGLDLSFTVAHNLANWLPDQATGRISASSLVCFTLSILALSFFATNLRWLCVPFAAIALIVLQPGPPPEAVLFEDGKQLALIDADGRIDHLSDRPNRFVSDQWHRVFAGSEPTPPNKRFDCVDHICRAQTTSAIRIKWTDDWRQWPAVCADADFVIVARAIRQRTCPNGVPLATLRTLRLTGSLGLYREANHVVVRPSVDPDAQPWNAHRRAPWPEFWRKDSAQQLNEASNDSGGLGPPADPGP